MRVSRRRIRRLELGGGNANAVTLRALAIVGCALLAGVAIAHADSSTSGSYGQPAPSADLLKVLSGIQKLDSENTLALHVWATYSKPDLPSPNLTLLDQIETAILVKLSPSERAATLTWLDHGGRAKLYALGVSDADIGPCIDMIDAPNCGSPVSNGGAAAGGAPLTFRDLPFTLAPGSNDAGGIQIEHGFAIVKTDATSETHCLSFKNAGSKKADGVTFVYKIYSQNGQVLSAGSNLRAGNFDPGAAVAGPASAADMSGIRSDSPQKALLDNCWTKTTQMATPELLRAAYITVGVVSVTYDDGTHWAIGQ